MKKRIISLVRERRKQKMREKDRLRERKTEQEWTKRKREKEKGRPQRESFAKTTFKTKGAAGELRTIF